MKHPQKDLTLHRAAEGQPAKAFAPVHVTREVSAKGALLHIQLQQGAYPVPPRQMVADYADAQVVLDAVHLVFGKLDAFDPLGQPLSYALQVSFPYSQFVRQLYRSIIEVMPPNNRPFLETVREAQRGYQKIESMPKVRGAAKQGHARANAAALFIYDDEACIDFFHLDAFALTQANQGVQDVNVALVVRIVTSPNVLGYFLDAVVRAADEVMRRAPALKEAANA